MSIEKPFWNEAKKEVIKEKIAELNKKLSRINDYIKTCTNRINAYELEIKENIEAKELVQKTINQLKE